MITIKDIARELDISPSTVSMALNDNPRVSEKTRKKVKALAKKLQYHPNMIARAMVQRKSQMIGLLISDVMSSFFPQIIQGVEDITIDISYSAIICPTNGNPEREREYMRTLREKRVDGVIAEPVENRENIDIWNELVERKVPLVSILNHPPVKGVCHVGVDNEKGGFTATEHLISNKHKIIAHLAGPQYFQTSRERLKGYREALAQNNLTYYDNLVLQTTFDWEAGYNNMRILLQSNPRPTAVFCAGDIIAIGASFALRQSGIRVPEDIALVGYDDLFIASIAEVPLTTVAQPKYHLGSLAARKLMSLIAGKEAKSEILQPTLTIRQSCGAHHKKSGAGETTAAEFKIQHQPKK